MFLCISVRMLPSTASYLVGTPTGVSSTIPCNSARMLPTIASYLVGPLAGVAAHVAPQLGQLDGRVVALRALVRLLVGVLVADVADQLAWIIMLRLGSSVMWKYDVGWN